MKRRIFLAHAVVALLLTLPVWADDAHHKADALTGGEVRKVDKETKKITIKHGPIKNLDMPAMTMVFQVKDIALLEQVKAGDAVKFRAEQIGDIITLTRIEKAQ
jgi:Cu/Ag efflux protein CusF